MCGRYVLPEDEALRAFGPFPGGCCPCAFRPRYNVPPTAQVPIVVSAPAGNCGACAFMVADGLRVWTGSYNLTRNCSRFNDNHAIVLESPELAENYLREWEEIYDGLHGKRSAYPTPHPEVNVGGTVVHNLFTPEDDVRGALVAEMDAATNEIAIMAFSFTSRR